MSRTKGENARRSPEIVWTAGPPNDRREGKRKHTEGKEGTRLVGMAWLLIDEQEAHLIYMSATYRLSILQ